jgi:hypothetical protein
MHRGVHLVSVIVVTVLIIAPTAYAQQLNCDDSS